MTEYVHVPTSLTGITDEIARFTIEMLVEQGKLPPDFEFRALAIDSQDRGKIALQDIMAGLGRGEPTGNPYLTEELLDCVQIFAGGTKSVHEILTEVAVDYHELSTLCDIAYYNNIPETQARQAWLQYIKCFDPNRRGSFSLQSIIIRDSALMQVYENPQLIKGHGPLRLRLLGALLRDNHPDIGLAWED